jgi:CHASE2 domain-containing sensor protein
VRKAYPDLITRLHKIIVAAFFAGIAALILILPPLGENLEQSGLDLLFHLRGTRETPPEVVIVAIDNHSTEALGLQQA